LVLDIVLGVSMAPASVQMILVEGENADGALVEEDEFDVTAADDSEPTSAPDRVISAILGTREGAADAGLQLSSIGVTWTDQDEAAVLRDALAAYKLENVMLVSAFLAATALAQSVGGAMGYDRTAVLFVEPGSATLAVVETADGSIADVYREQIDDASSGEATAQLTGMLSGLEDLETAPGGVFVVGSGVDVASIKPALESATSLNVSAPEEPETALARGAALASANAPLFASSTAALAYAQDVGTGAIDPYVLPEYLSIAAAPLSAELGEDDLAYSLVPDEDADAPTVLIDVVQGRTADRSQPRRRPVLLLGSGVAVVGITAVVALEIALAIGIRTTVALQPSPNQSLIVPTQTPAPAPPQVEASVPHLKVDTPMPVTAPKPLNPPVAAPVPAAPAPEAPAPVAPVVPVPVVVPPAIVPVPEAPHLPILDPLLRAPLLQAPTPQSPLQPLLPQPRTHIPGSEGVPTQQPPVHQTPPWQGTSPNPRGPGGGQGGVPHSGPGGGGGTPIHSPGSVTGGSGGGPISGPEPGGPRGEEPFGGGGFPGSGGFPGGGEPHGSVPGGSGPFGGGGIPGGGGGHSGGGHH
jgi:hypothetical protein